MAENLEKLGGVDTTEKDSASINKAGVVASRVALDFEELGEALTNLSKSIKLNKNISSQFEKLSTTFSKLKAFSNEKTTIQGMKNVASFLEEVSLKLNDAVIKLNSLSSLNLTKFSTQMLKLYDAIRPFSGFKTDAGGLITSLTSLQAGVEALNLIYDVMPTKALPQGVGFEDLEEYFSLLKSSLSSLEGMNIKVGNTIKSLKGLKEVAEIMSTLNLKVPETDETGYTNLAKQVNALVQALTPLETVKSKLGATLKQLNSLPTMISSLDKVTTDDSGFVKLKETMTSLADAFASLGKINRGSLASLIKNLTRAFGEGGTLRTFMKGKDLSGFVNNMKAIRKGFTQISNLPKTNLSSLTNSVVKFTNGLMLSKQLGEADILKVSNMILKLAESITPLQSFESKNIGKLISNIARIPKVINSISDLKPEQLKTFTDNVNRLAEALIPLEERLSKISLGFKAFPSNLIKTANGLENVYKKSRKATFGVNTLLNRFLTGGGIFYFARRIASAITESISISNDFVETLNIVGVSFGQFTTDATKTVEEWNKFLGIDPGEALEKWSELNLLLKGFGDGSEEWVESSYKMSENLTKLAYDLSSLYNVEVEDALERVQSAMSGMSKPMRRFGIDISEAALKEYALSNGIEKSVENMTQMEKAQLRYGIMLEKTRGAQGDLQKTLESPANLLRVFDSYVTQLKRTIGELFTPLITTYVPYVIGAMSSMIGLIERISKSIDSLFGYKRPEAEDYISYIAEESALANEEVEELGDSVGNLLSGIDKFNVLNKGSNEQGGSVFSSLLGNLEDYDFLDDSKEAFKEYKDTFDKIFEPLAKSVETIAKVFDKLNINGKIFSKTLLGISAAIVGIISTIIILTGVIKGVFSVTHFIAELPKAMANINIALAAIKADFIAAGTVIKTGFAKAVINAKAALATLRIEIELLTKRIGNAIKKIYSWIASKLADVAASIKAAFATEMFKASAAALAIQIGVLSLAMVALIGGIATFISLAGKMGPWQKVIVILGALAAAATTAAIAFAVLHTSWTMGIAAATIAAGVTLAVGSIVAATSTRKFANGGFNPSGNLMFTNENGAPEWVGRQGNSSAVVNDTQMSDVMYQSVRNGVTDALLLGGSGSSQEQELTINLKGMDDNALARALAKPLMDEFKRQGYKLVRV